MPAIGKIYKNGTEYHLGLTFVITEDMVTVEKDSTKGVAPYSTSYGYTNITINDNSGISWIEGAVYVFIINTKMAVASANRNIRIRIGTGGDWKPIMGSSSSIMAGSSYFVKTRMDLYVYKTTYQSGGALHLNNDTSYSAMSVAEGKTATATSSRLMRSDYLKQIIEYHAGNLHDNTKQDTLVSGTNIKTVGGESLLGSGNIDIGGGGFENISNMVYNSDDLLVSFTGDGKNYTLTYDEDGAIHTINDGTNTWTITYNSDGNLSGITKS